MLFFFPAYGTNPRTMTQTRHLGSNRSKNRNRVAIRLRSRLFSFLKKWAERNERVKSDARKKRGDGMETLSSVACKLYEYLYFAIVFRLSVEERNWASSSSLIIAHFIFFCLLARISPESFHSGWLEEKGTAFRKRRLPRRSIPGESDIKIARIQRGYKNRAGC